MVYNELTVQIDKFKAYFFIQFKVWWSGPKLCLMPGYQYGAITLYIKTALKQVECYKTYIEKLCDFTNWTGQSAKFFDNCDLSSKEDVTFWSKELLAAATDQYLPSTWNGAGTDGCYTIGAGTIGESIMMAGVKYMMANFPLTVITDKDLQEKNNKQQ